MRSLRIALAQINSTVGALEANASRICAAIERARSLDADLVCLPEMAVPGYPPEDLLLRPNFVTDNRRALDRIVRASRGVMVVVGFVDRTDDIYNAAAVIANGRLVTVYHKIHLPNYGVFDENRYFQAGTERSVVEYRGVRLGVNICEDIWLPEGPALAQCLGGDAEVIVNINASPFHRGKLRWREEMLATRARDNLVFVAYTNMVGGQDELIFDGRSLIVDPLGRVLARGRAFDEDLVVADLDVDAVTRARLQDTRHRKQKRAFAATDPPVPVFPVASPSRLRPKKRVRPQLPEALNATAEVYQALVLGIRDYVRKNGFETVVIGMSGGVDSSLVAVLAVDALGAKNVVGVFMPSQYTAAMSHDDAHALARAAQIRWITLSIQELYQGYLKLLEPEFKPRRPDSTEENIQSRIRGTLLMALSNKFGWLVLTTGNKSEMSMGYATLYGDMAGGFAALKDVPKTLVYQLARYRNGMDARPLIPERVFTRPPSAELRPDQKDTDSLPPYDVLDPIILAYVEEDRDIESTVAQGFDRHIVERVARAIDRNEFKRRQAPVGIKITPRAFGRDRRMPITNRYQPSARRSKTRRPD